MSREMSRVSGIICLGCGPVRPDDAWRLGACYCCCGPVASLLLGAWLQCVHVYQEQCGIASWPTLWALRVCSGLKV